MYRTRKVRSRGYRSQSASRSFFVIALLALGILIGVLGMRVSQPRRGPGDAVPAASPAVEAPSRQAPQPSATPAPSRPRSVRNG